MRVVIKASIIFQQISKTLYFMILKGFRLIKKNDGKIFQSKNFNNLSKYFAILNLMIFFSKLTTENTN